MKNSTLVRMIKKLTPEEIKSLDLFIQSPYFNSNQTNIRLFNFIKTNRFHFNYKNEKISLNENDILSKENVYKIIYPNDKKYNRKKITDRMSYLTNLIKEFLIQEKLKTHKTIRDRLLIEAYQDKKAINPLRQKVKQLSKNFEIAKNKNVWDYLDFLPIYYNIYSGSYHQSGDIFKNISFESVMINNIEKNYLLGHLFLGLKTIARKKYLSSEHEHPHFHNILRIAKEKYSSDLVFKLTLSLIELYKKLGTKSKLRKTMDFLFNNWEDLQPFDRNLAITYLLNYIVSSKNNLLQEEIFIEESFNLYKFGVESKILLKGNTITQIVFFNTITTSLQNNKADWCKYFIQNFSQYLPPEEKEEVLTLSWGQYYFFQNDYFKTMEIIDKIKYSSLQLSFISRILLLKTYFKLYQQDNTYFKMTIAFANSTEKYMKRNNKHFGESRTDSYLMLITQIKSAINLIEQQKDTLKWEEYFQKLEKSYFFSKKWLQNQLANY